jgi:hypothetical protein
MVNTASPVLYMENVRISTQREFLVARPRTIRRYIIDRDFCPYGRR